MLLRLLTVPPGGRHARTRKLRRPGGTRLVVKDGDLTKTFTIEKGSR